MHPLSDATLSLVILQQGWVIDCCVMCKAVGSAESLELVSD
jgi:hypothetical protein